HTLLVLGGIHGDEPKSVRLVRRLVDELERDSPLAAAVRWVLVPVVNPDGYERRKRRNARGVDVNRNFPTTDWTPGSPRSRMYGGLRAGSEPETRAVMRAVERFKPDAIVTVHSIDGRRHCNNYDGPAETLARAMSRRNGYPVRGSIGYPTPGSLGTWAGVERRIPVVTLELPSHHCPQRCWRDNRDALLCAAAFAARSTGR
ncbi:MAG: DUF2817 domain-containing protein, partial [Planctomycetota bacterium]